LLKKNIQNNAANKKIAKIDYKKKKYTGIYSEEKKK
jgi:hypothetical protein